MDSSHLEIGQMMRLLLPVLPPLWTAVLFALVWSHRPEPSRLVRAGAAVERRGPAAVVGRFLARLTGVRMDPAIHQRLGRAIIAAALTFLVEPLVALPVGLGLWFAPVVRARGRDSAARAQLVRDLPDVVDLFRLAVSAGLTVPLAVPLVARRIDGSLGEGLREVAYQVGLGAPVAESLEQLTAELGDDVRPLIAALVASVRYGVPLDDALERVAGEVRTRRRRRAELAARRVPVRLLLPLVFCILPAFALLTVIPMLIGTFRSLTL